VIDERSPPDRSGRAAERPEGLSVTHSGKSRPTGMHWPSTAAARSCPLQALHYRAQLTVLVTSASAARASEAKVDHFDRRHHLIWPCWCSRRTSGSPCIADVLLHCHEPPQWANKRLPHRSKTSPLFDHLIGDGEHARRDGEAECLGNLEIDDQFDFRGLLDRQVGRVVTLEDAPV
jgi:hypothetical protein